MKNYLNLVLCIFLSSCSMDNETEDFPNLENNSRVISLTSNNNPDCSNQHLLNINQSINDLSNMGGGTLKLEEGLHYITGQIVLKDNVNLEINGSLEKFMCPGSNNFYLIRVDNVENVKIQGSTFSKIKTVTDSVDIAIYIGNSRNINLVDFSIQGDKSSDWAGSGVLINSSNDVSVKNLKISNFLNKGISVSGSGVDNIVISENTITGSNSSSGAGISIADFNGGSVRYSEVSSNYIDSSRIGITINSSRFINILKNHCVNNKMGGISLDGDQAASGDGAQSCIVSNNFIIGNGYGRDDCGSLEYSGIYLGNGADKNIITENIVRENGYGIAYNEADGTDPTNSSYNNTISSNQIIQNRWRGMKFRKMKRAIITENEIIQNLIGGIEFEDSTIENHIIKDNNVVLNGNTGVIFNNCLQVNDSLILTDNIITGHEMLDETTGTPFNTDIYITTGANSDPNYPSCN